MLCGVPAAGTVGPDRIDTSKEKESVIMFLATVNIIAFLICLLMLSYFWKESLVEMFPVLTCMLSLTLYILAFFRRMDLIDGIGMLMITAFVIWLIGGKRERRKLFARECLQKITQPSFVTAVLLLFAVGLCTSQKIVTWWDDINFWATDVKSLYYLNGFAGKYENVAPEFGDYPPGGQMIKWWFLHFDPHTFREGLAFAGYYFMNLVFMLPLLKKIRGKNIFVLFGMAASLWFLPGIAEVYGYDGFCADLTMACIYGGFLFAVIDREGKRESFYYGRLMLYLSVLVLVKSVGFIWAFFGLVFFILFHRQGEKKSRLAAVCAAPVITGGSWMLFCLLMRRVTKTTTTAVRYMTTDEYGISGYTGDFAKAFLKAFAGLPLHKSQTPVLDLTPLGFYLCICLIVIFFYHRNLMPKKQGRLVLWFGIISGALFYGIIFIAHITIFATETQYLEASGMISSIERYGAPFTVGTLLFLMFIWMECGGALFVKRGEETASLSFTGLRRIKRIFSEQYGPCLCLILFVALTTQWRAGYHGLIGYRSETEGQSAQRADMIDEDAALFLETIDALGTEHGARVCYVQRDDEPRWVRNSYVNLEASPVSVVYKSVNLDDAVTDWMVQEIRSLHAEYLYVEHTDADIGKVFNNMTVGGAFSCEALYRIEDDGMQMRLVQVR